MTDRPLLLAVPNISEGRNPDLIRRVAGQRSLLDTHSDVDHNRTVLTYADEPSKLSLACTEMLDRAVEHLDVRIHEGAHPRFGVVDVLPIVPYAAGTDTAREITQEIADHAAVTLHVPAYFYDEENPLPQLRRMLRSSTAPTHPTAGVVCIGVRSTLIAFNVNLRTDMVTAREIVRDVRTLPGVRALVFALPSRRLLQVSMNLTEPERTGPKAAYERVAALGVDVVDAEIVGLVPQSSLPELDEIPLRKPARSVEEALGRRRNGNPFDDEVDE